MAVPGSDKQQFFGPEWPPCRNTASEYRTYDRIGKKIGKNSSWFKRIGPGQKNVYLVIKRSPGQKKVSFF